MVEFLSDAWLDEMATAASDIDEHAREDGGPPPLTLRQIISGGPRGDVVYDLLLADGRVTMDRSRTADPDVTFKQDRATAIALARGDTHPHIALTTGRLDISGPAHRLVDWRSTLDALSEALADLRDATTWA